ncbi:Crp/Fnr family transcriptional regulator [Clostridium sp. SYSU_GA19001]|uniref:Crp/Fnr family transcriptional regulator n=1 Tax=Clostridium caldaquaticum TaxID=2940653 RepID=UPI002077632A|nr:Crp/Fnr family transcriptional regulator [Clostridium caldaquaticum]MCM8709667.1 Crp/Fnr family transcriptional regulator [Clostridium caldaquaticum]
MSIVNYFKAIKSSSLFKTFTEEDLISLFSKIPYKVEKYNKGDIILAEDDSCNTLNLILEGSLEVQKNDSTGKVLSIAEFGSGEIFGEMLIFADKNTAPINVIAKTKCTVLHINKASVISLCQNNSGFLLEYLRIISNKAMILNLKLKEVTLKTIRQKISEYILAQYNQQNSLKIKLNMTKKDWADKIGVQRPSLSRELIKMKEDEIIDYNKDIIIIKNLEALEEFL